MEEALYEVAPLRRFAGMSLARGSVPDETTILNFKPKGSETLSDEC
jgi:IS5 family transposase